MSHHKPGQRHNGNPHRHAGESPTNPLHVKIVPSEEENEPQSEELSHTAQFEEKPPARWKILRRRIWRGITSDRVTSLATSILALFATGSFILLWIQISDARDAFSKDQRPYVWLTKDGLGNPKFIPQQDNPVIGQVTWEWHFTNYGKTPAYHVRYFQSMSIDGGPFTLSYGAPPDGDFGPPLPPSEDVRSDVVSVPGITRDQIVHAAGPGGGGIIISVKLQYTDSAGNPHETGICLKTLTGSTAIAFCSDESLNYIQ